MLDRPNSHRFRTLFLSDTHLGSRACKTDRLIDFLARHDAETVYLVGDIIDGWRLRRGWYWPQAHSDVVQMLFQKARRGTRIIYVPGNHERFFRQYLGLAVGGVEVIDRAIHVTADGRRFLVIHGDQFDTLVRRVDWLAFVGMRGYRLAVFAKRGLDRLSRRFGGGSAAPNHSLRLRVRKAVKHIRAFEQALFDEARQEKANGVVCGHIHHPTIIEIDGFRYVNTGDWVESCTAVVEHHNGAFENPALAGDEGRTGP
jgi:UDP-2,3-diacylglucosamine pyrophosphatase LpxH